MNRVAVVTGAARGIGAATVRGLAAAGWAVVAVDRCRDDPRLPYGMGTEAELATWWPRLRPSRHGRDPDPSDRRPTGGGGGGRHHRPEELASAVAIGRGAVRWTRRGGGGGRCDRRGGPAVGDARRPAGRGGGGRPRWSDHRRPGRHPRPPPQTPAPRQGRFLAVASAAAARGLPTLAAYGAAKAGVAGLVRGLAVELGGTGITANAVSPGSTSTAMLTESARLYGLDGHPVVRRPAADRTPPWSRRSGGHAGVAGRCRQRRPSPGR